MSEEHQRLAASLLAELESLDMARFRIVGGYTRYSEAVRNALADAKQRILAGLDGDLAQEVVHAVGRRRRIDTAAQTKTGEGSGRRGVVEENGEAPLACGRKPDPCDIAAGLDQTAVRDFEKQFLTSEPTEKE